MSSPIEDRLRAHYADRTTRDAFPASPHGDMPHGDMPAAPGPPQRFRRAPLLLAAAAVLAVCGIVGSILVARDDDEPRHLDVIAPSITLAPPTTGVSPSTSTPSTTLAPTTTVPPASFVRSVIASVDGVLGSWDGSRWVPYAEGVAVRGGETYTLVGLGKIAGSAIGGAPVTTCDHNDPPPVVVDLGLKRERYRQDLAPIAILGAPDPAPRSVAVLSNDSSVYRRVVTDALAAERLDVPDPQLTQVLRTDLDGDGSDEVILVAERMSDRETLFATEGDYSIVLLRAIVEEQVVTTVLWRSIARGPEWQVGYPFVHFAWVSAIADANGDGTMEVVLQTEYYEGASTALLNIERGEVTEALIAGCGV